MSRKRKGERGKGTIIIDLLVWRQRCCHCSPPLLHGRNGDGLFLPLLSGKRKGGGGRFAILFFLCLYDIFLRKVKGKDCCKKICQRWRRIPRILKNSRRHDFVGWSVVFSVFQEWWLPAGSQNPFSPLCHVVLKIESLICGGSGEEKAFFALSLWESDVNLDVARNAKIRGDSGIAQNRNSIFSLKKRRYRKQYCLVSHFFPRNKKPTFSLFYFLDPSGPF